jgi:hypothetical protein
MKRLLIVAAFVLPILISCNKDDNGGGTPVNYSGTYKGTINIQTNGTASGTLTDHSMTFTEQGGGVMTFTNSVFAANTGKVSGTTFTLDKKIIASSPTYNTEQTGTAVFSGTNVVISFKEQEIDNSTSAVLNTKTWTGTLVKQ